MVAMATEYAPEALSRLRAEEQLRFVNSQEAVGDKSVRLRRMKKQAQERLMMDDSEAMQKVIKRYDW